MEPESSAPRGALARTAAIIRGVYFGHGRHGVGRMSAALSYYALLAFAPLLTVAILIGGFFSSGTQVATLIASGLTPILGEETTAQILSAVSVYVSRSSQATLVATVSALLALWGSINLLNQVIWALHEVWEVPPPANVRGEVMSRLISLAVVGVLCATLLVVATLLAATSAHSVRLPTGGVLAALTLLATGFAAAYHYLSGAHPSWRISLLAGVPTAVVYTIGAFGLGAYLGTSFTVSAYGAAGSMLAVLIWFYFSAEVFLLGGELAREFSDPTPAE